MSSLPPGFVLNQPEAQQAGALPEGFVVNAAPTTPPAAQDRSTWDVLTGADGGERYQTWPERMARGLLGSVASAATLPGDVYAGRVDPMSEDGIRRANEMAGLLTPVNPAVRSGEAIIPGVKNALVQPKVAPPSAKELEQAAKSGYDSFREMGVEYSSDAVRNIARSIRTSLEQDGILGELAPKSFSILKKLANPPKGSVATGSGLEAARRALGNAGRDFNNPTDQLAASRIVRGLDDFVMGADPESVVAGSAAAAADTLRSARGNYAAAQRSDLLTGIQTSAERRAAAANSGQNLGNSIRQRAASALERPKDIAGFNAAERAAVEGIAQGSPAANATRWVGNYLGGGGGLGAVAASAGGAGIGFAAGGPIGGGAGAFLGPLVGSLSRGASNRLTERSLRLADELVRRRSPLYEQMLAMRGLEARNPEPMAAILRGLMSAGYAAQPPSR